MSGQTYRVSVEVIADKAKAGVSQLKSAFENLEKGTNKAGRELEKLDRQSQMIGKSLGVLKGALGALGLGMGLSSIIQTADSMQVLNDQVRLATGTTEKYGIAMQNIERIAMQNKVSLQSVGEMYVSNERALKQLGKSQQEVISFTENVTKAMAVGGGSAEAQAAALTQLGQAMASGVLRGDEFNSIAEQAPMIMELMADSLNVTTGELRKMAAEGKLTAETVYQALTSVSATDKLGQMTGKTATTVAGAMQEVSNQWEIAVNKIMNGEGGISQALAGMISNFAGVIPKVVEFGEAFIKSKEGQAIIDGVKTAIEMLKGAVTGIGELLAPVIDFLSSNPEIAFALASGLAAMAGAIGLVSAASAIAAGAVGAFTAAVGFLTSPITLVALAIGGLVAAGVYLYRNWDDLKAKAQEVWQGVQKYVTDAWSGVQNAWNGAWFDGIWQDVKTSATKQWDDIKNGISNKSDEIKTTATTKFNEIKEAASRAFNGLPEPVRSALTSIVGVVRGQFELVKNIFTTAFNVIKALVRGDMEGVKNAISSGLQNAASIARTMVTNIVGVFKNLGAQLLQAGRDAVQGFINGFSAKMNEAYNKAREMASKVISTVKSALDIHSPSREMKKLGRHTADGMAVGIEQNTPKAVKAAQKMADDIKKTVADSVANLKREIALFGNDSPIDALKYDISIGKYKGADTKELEALTAQKYALERNKVVLDEIDGIKEKIALVGKNELETLKYQLDHADKYKGISDDIKKSYLERTEALNQAIKAQERLSKVEAATADIAKNKHILANWQDKHAGLKYDLGKDGYDASQIEQIVQAEVVKEQVGKLQQLFSDISNKQVFATPNITANLANNGGGFDFAGQMLGQSFDIVKKFEEQNALLKAAREQGLIEEEVYLKQSEALTQAHVEAKAALMQTATQSVLGGITGIMKNVYGEQSKHYKAAFAMEKAYAVATILMKQKEAIAKAWASAPFPANLGAVASTLASTGALAAAVNAIRPVGQAHDGIMSVPKSGTWNLEKGERVLPKHTAQNLDNTLNRLQGRGETKVIINNYTGEKATAQQMPNGDVLVTIGKMIDDKVDAKVNQRFIQARRQGGELYGR